jgi:hypothetical protein
LISITKGNESNEKKNQIRTLLSAKRNVPRLCSKKNDKHLLEAENASKEKRKTKNKTEMK